MFFKFIFLIIHCMTYLFFTILFFHSLLAIDFARKISFVYRSLTAVDLAKHEEGVIVNTSASPALLA